MNRRILLGVMFSAIFSVEALPVSGAAPAPVASPLEIVQKIYAISAGKDGKYRGSSAFENKAVRKLYFSKSFFAAVERAYALAKKRDEPVIDFDPVLNTQEDPEVKDLKIAVESETPTNSVIAAAFVSYDEKNIVRYEFIKEGSLWKLDNMRGEGSGDKWSLRDIVK